jgi:two-component system CheB/CheR fusion protein
MNEELQTVNQENRHKVEELGQLSSDLQNLLAATDIATLFLDRSLRILRFTPKVDDLFNIRTSDRGRPLSDLSHRLVRGDIASDAAKVLKTLVPVEGEITDDRGRWYLVRVLPYRSQDDRIEGVVITFVDITARKEAETRLQRLTETLEERVAERTSEVDALARQLTIAEQEERRRVSTILHDDLQQVLHAVSVKLRMMRKALPANDVELGRAVDEAVDRIAQAVKTTRTLTVDLTPPILRSEGLPEALAWLCHQMSELHGLEVELNAEPGFSLTDEAVRALAFQTVREVLFNIKKHAGTDRATVSLAQKEKRPVIAVWDEGVGFDTETLSKAYAQAGTGFGLATLRDRLRLIGGNLEINSRPGFGTDVTISLPAS